MERITTLMDPKLKHDMYYYKEIFDMFPSDKIKSRLKDAKELISFLESIYIIGAPNNFYSQDFKDAAYKERQEICQITSACYSILRDRGEEV